MEVESALTATLERVEPWLSSYKPNPHATRVRPLPRTKEEALHVFAVARNLAARTSAPAGWNPNAPVMGFSTPNPLPHQLRGGALAALQLQQAKAERENKRKRLEKTVSESAHSSPHKSSSEAPETDEAVQDPKRRELKAHEKELNRSASDMARADAARRVRLPQPKQEVSMNLSDSSSEEDEDDD